MLYINPGTREKGDAMGFYEENDVFQKKEENTYARIRFQDMGKKVSTLFWLTIATFIMTLLMMGIGVFVGLAGELTLFGVIMAISVIVGLAINIVYAANILSMGKYNERMTTAGICYIILEVLSAIENLFFNDSGFGTLISIVELILVIIYMLNFSKAMEEIVFPANMDLSGSWENIRKAFIITLIAYGVGMFLALILGGFGMFVMVISLIVLIVVGIIYIVLLYKSGRAMLSYADRL